MWSMQRFQSSFGAQHKSSCHPAFTLIELLVVIAIILILISIALPNFLKAQLRAKVTQAKGELHGLGTAMEQYCQDYSAYPAKHDTTVGCACSDGIRYDTGLYWMTSPTKYVSFDLCDPFRDRWTSAYHLNGNAEATRLKYKWSTVTWYLRSCGPDKDCYLISPWEPVDSLFLNSYCPTNGTVSEGDIFRWGGDPFWIGTRLATADMRAYRKHIVEGNSIDGPVCFDWVLYLHNMPPSLK